MAEIAFEYLLAGLESTRGTPPANPTHYLPLAGTLTPKKERYRPNESRGMLAEYFRSVDVRHWAEFEAKGGADVYILPLLLNTLVKGGVSTPTTPPGATAARLWEFPPTMDADDLQAMTLWFGDPNVQVFRSTYCMVDELTITGEASGTDGVTMSVKGQGRFPTKNVPGSVPTILQAPLLVPGAMQVWIDTANIGATEVVGRVASAEITIPLGGTRKWLAAGPSAGLDFQALGRGKRHAELKLTLELPDLTQYDQWEAATTLKTRVRFNGPLIETGFYHFVEFDIYGPFDGLDLGENEGSRTIELTILSEYDVAAGYDFCVRVQNDRNAL